jgi:hypothetical protein
MPHDVDPPSLLNYCPTKGHLPHLLQHKKLLGGLNLTPTRYYTELGRIAIAQLFFMDRYAWHSNTTPNAFQSVVYIGQVGLSE